MKSLTVKSLLNRIFNLIFGFVFLGLFLDIARFGYENQTDSNSFDCNALQHKQILLAGLVFVIGFVLVYILIDKISHLKKLDSIKNKDRDTKIIIFSSVGLMLLVQLVVAYFIASSAVSDLEVVNNYAMDFGKTGNFDKIQMDFSKDGYAYMLRYPNNHALMFLLAIPYRIYYLLTGEVSEYVAIALNCVAINVSVLFTVLLSRKIYGNKKSLMTLLLCLLFVPYYTFTTYYYTDSLSMPFIIAGAYLMVCAAESDKRVSSFVMIFFVGVITLIGYKIKGSVILLIPAAILYLLLKLNFKRAISLLLVFVIGFGVTFLSYNAAYDSIGVATEEQFDKYEIPIPHWIMMGLNGLGHYSRDDFSYTVSFETKDEKTEADIKVIKERLYDLCTADPEKGEKTLFEHLRKKAMWTWQDGTYYICHHIKKPLHPDAFLRKFVDMDGDYRFYHVLYTCGYQLFMLFMFAVSGLTGAFKKKLDSSLLVKILIFGIFLFLLIWETRSRYLYDFTPLFIILASDGVFCCSSMIKFLKQKITKKH